MYRLICYAHCRSHQVAVEGRIKASSTSPNLHQSSRKHHCPTAEVHSSSSSLLSSSSCFNIEGQRMAPCCPHLAPVGLVSGRIRAIHLLVPSPDVLAPSSARKLVSAARESPEATYHGAA
mmetsp:Transcript_12464/g.24193  ORF Transcript_12464/g.24193 Transcript_12464/m.24193 type:complete len:120 (+) Transcript_12464:458-817(+)